MQFPNPYLTQGYQNPVYTPYNPMPQQQNMTHVIQTSIIQVDSADDLNKFQLNAGQNQMFMSSDDKYIFIKSATENGCTVETYERKPTPKAPEYVTKDDLLAIFKEFGIVKEPTNEPV